MNNNQHWRKRLILLCAVAGVSLSPMLAGPSYAQSKKTPAKVTPKATPKPKKAPASPPEIVEDTTPAAPVKGLNGLGDDALMTELSGRGLETLLNEAFAANKIAPAQQSGIRAMRGLALLTDKTKKLTASQRQEIIRNVVNGLKTVLPQLNDPRRLMEASGILLTEGAARDVNLIEYWGETPAAQARLKPVAEAVSAMLDKANKAAVAERAGIEKRMHNVNNQRLADEWTAMEELANQASYTRYMATYNLALATSRQPDMSARETIVNEAVAGLKEFDVEDSGLQTVVKNRIAKMLMTKGDYPGAKAAFNDVIGGKTKPAADVNQIYEAKYFSVLCDLQSGDVATAGKELTDLIQWQQANMPKAEDVQKGVAAAAEMMRYRLALAESELSQGEDKKKFEKAAVDVLLKLSTDRPELRSIIYEQLVERVGNSQPVKGMDPLLLRALMQKAEGELDRDKPSAAVLERGAEAGRELIARSATDKTIDAGLAESAAYFVGAFLAAADKKVEAASAFLDFLEKFPKSKSRENAFNNAGRLVILDLRKGDKKGDADVVAVYDRFLPIAIKPPFNRKDLAFDYAQRLRQEKPPKYKEAASYYALVPPTDSRYAPAKFLQMISLTGILDQRLPNKKPVIAGKEREALVAQVLQLTDEVKKVALANIPQAKTDDLKNRSRGHVAWATLTAAQIAADEQKDSKKVLALLATFEKDTEGLPGVDEMMKDVMFRRVKAYMDAGQDNEATATLLTLLNKTGGQKGADIVLGLLQKMNDNYRKAEAAGDEAGMAQLSKNRALLSGRLVEWASKSTNPDIKKFIYSYSVFDAESKLLAGRLNKDPAMVKASLAAFQKLMEPAMVELYKQEIAQNERALASYKEFPYHANVLKGLGLAQFEVGDYRNAQQNLGRLVYARKLGTEVIDKVDPATKEVTFVDNDAFWECWYKLLRCNVELYKADRTGKDADAIFAAAKSGLKKLYIINRHPGGEQWASQFEKLRTEIIPEFDPSSIPVSNPTSQPATQATQPVAKNDGK